MKEKMDNYRIGVKFLCVILAGIISVQTAVTVFAQAKSDNYYLSDIKLSTSNSSTSFTDAKSELSAQGYIVSGSNSPTPYDLNSGTDKGSVCIGYKLTTDRSQAITDINFMNMNGGFQTVDYREIANRTKSKLNEVATELKNACAELKTKYDAGSPAAKAAKAVLDVFKNDESKALSFGDWLMSNERTVSDFSDLIMICNSKVVASILTQIAIGVSDYNSNTWLERMASYQESDFDNISVSQTEEFRIKSKNVLTSVQSFAKNYKNALAKKQAGSLAQTDEMNTYLIAYECMNKYTYCGEKIGDYFIKLGESDNVTDELYPILMAMSNGQYAMLHTGYFTTLILGIDNTEKNYSAASENLSAVKKEIQQDTNDGKISIYAGVDKSIYDKEVGLTQEAYRTISAKNNYDALTTDTDSLDKKLVKLIESAGCVALVSFGTAMIVSYGISVATGIAATALGTALWTSATTSIGSLVAAISVYGPVAIAVTAVAVIIVFATAYLINYITEKIKDSNPEYTAIPDTMYSRENDDFIKYSAVTTCGGNPVDINNASGRTWNALYYTKDAKAGSPIQADENGNIFYAKYDNGIIPNAYEAVAEFGETQAANLNTGAYKDYYNGVYLFYHTENSLKDNDNSDKDNDDENNGKKPKVSDNTQYLNELKVFNGKTQQEVLSNIKQKGYKYLNYNLTASQKNYTYLGYKTSESIGRYTIRDIRITYKYSADSFSFGDAVYGNAGSFGDLTLWYSSMEQTGDPIYAKFYVSSSMNSVPSGYEGVNLFSGGNAFDLNSYDEKGVDDYSNCTYLYFLPSVIYTSGQKYISGINFVGGTTTDDVTLNDYIKQLQLNDFGYNLNTQTDLQGEMRMCYSTTYNPHRAITDVLVCQQDAENAMIVPNISTEEQSYTACDVYAG